MSVVSWMLLGAFVALGVAHAIVDGLRRKLRADLAKVGVVGVVLPSHHDRRTCGCPELGPPFVCRQCRRLVPACFGADDDLASFCDDCVREGPF